MYRERTSVSTEGGASVPRVYASVMAYTQCPIHVRVAQSYQASPLSYLGRLAGDAIELCSGIEAVLFFVLSVPEASDKSLTKSP